MIETRRSPWLRSSSRNFNQLQQWLPVLTTKDNLPRHLLERLETKEIFIKAS
jgi:hypothetical protein